MIGVIYILSQILGIMGFALLLPAAIGLASGDPAGQIFLVVAGLVGFIAGAAYFALQGRTHRLSRVNGIIVVAIVWLCLPLVAAIPIVLALPIGIVNAVFEASSGLTTTGASIFSSLSDVGPAIIFWRAELQWLGGLLTLVTFAAILMPLGMGGLYARGLAITGDRHASVGHTMSLIGEIGFVYAIGTGLCIVLLSVSGVPAFDATCIALSTVSTGGFMPHDGDLSTYASPRANVIVAVFMLIGATSIVWQRLIIDWRRTHLNEHWESYAVLLIIAVAGIGYTLVFVAAPLQPVPDALADGFFAAVSLISTTGFETRNGGLAALPGSIAIFLAFAGGAALSTAGGLKLYRIGAMLAQSSRELHRLVFPNSVRGFRFGFQAYDPGLMKAIWANLALSLFVIVVSAVALSMDLPSIDSAFTAAVAAFSNIGPLYSSFVADGNIWPAVADFDGVSKLVMIATMILGRIEVFAFLAIFGIADWRA
jgi:trk system potassium uptake protein TrkH